MKPLLGIFVLIHILSSTLGSIIPFQELRSPTGRSISKEFFAAIEAESPKNDKTKEPEVQNTFPPEGLYLIMRNDLISEFGAQLTLMIGNAANTYSYSGQISGQTDSVSYTFSQFFYDIDLEQFSLMNGPSSPEIGFQWGVFQFVFQFKYHICANSWPNPCENGYITIWTMDDNGISVNTELTLNLAGPTVSLTANSATLNIGPNQVEVEVDCTDFICVIPTGDIANAVAQQFQPTVQQGLVQSINTAAAQLVNTIETTINIPEYHLSLALDGSFQVFPSGSNPGIVFYGQGQFAPDQGPHQNPPFSPTVSPPDTIFESPAAPLTAVFTDYLLRTAIWAMDINGDFNMNVTQEDMPAKSPVKLSTNDAFFRAAVPGLKNFPNLNISVDTSLYNVSGIQITPSGVLVTNTIQAIFDLYNSTFSTSGWTLLLNINFMAVLETSVDSQTKQIIVTADLSQWKCFVTVVKSNVGDVSASFFGNFITLALTEVGYNPPPVYVPTFPGFGVSGPSISMDSGFVQGGCSASYINPIPSVPCPGSTKACPLQNTCCKYSDGSFNCCTLPQASCCPSWCCPNGSVCCDQGCC